jgi:hypothetical protein
MGLTNSAGKMVTAQDAAADVRQFQRTTNTRIVHPMKPWIAEAKKTRIHVINVGPWAHEIWAGSYGKFIIPMCPLDCDYVEMVEFIDGKWQSPICAVQTEQVIKNEAEMEEQSEDGRQFAWEILGEGRGQNSAFSLRHRGCMVIQGEEPTKAELAEARAALEEDCRRMVAEARDLWASNEPNARQAIVKGRHDVAAQILNLTDEPWIVSRNPEARQKCPICGTMSEAQVLKCPGCKEHVFDYAAYGAMLAKQEEQIEAAKNAARKGK